MTLKRYLAAIVASLLLCASALGEPFQTSADSIAFRPTKWQRFENSALGRGLMAGVPLMVISPLAKSGNHEFRSFRHDFMPRYNNEIDNWLQYTPALALVGMKVAGLESESSWGQMLTADAFSVAVMAAAVNIAKRSVGELRPDQTNRKSFPSGHTATAFMTATMLSHEYGLRYPWVSVGAYTMATATGLMRMDNNRHWLNDIMMGAGIGIVSVEVGYLLSNLVFHKPLLGDDIQYDDYSTSWRPSFIGLYMASNTPLSRLRPSKGVNLKVRSGATVGLEGAWFLNRYLGIGGRGAFSNLNFDDSDSCDPDDRAEGLRMASAMAGAYSNLPLSGRFQLGAKLLLGYAYYYELDDQTYGRHIPASGAFGAATGLWLNFRVQPALSYRLFCDYDIYTPQKSTGEALQTLNLGGSVNITF